MVLQVRKDVEENNITKIRRACWIYSIYKFIHMKYGLPPRKCGSIQKKKKQQQQQKEKTKTKKHESTNALFAKVSL